MLIIIHSLRPWSWSSMKADENLLLSGMIQQSQKVCLTTLLPPPHTPQEESAGKSYFYKVIRLGWNVHVSQGQSQARCKEWKGESSLLATPLTPIFFFEQNFSHLSVALTIPTPTSALALPLGCQEFPSWTWVSLLLETLRHQTDMSRTPIMWKHLWGEVDYLMSLSLGTRHLPIHAILVGLCMERKRFHTDYMAPPPPSLLIHCFTVCFFLKLCPRIFWKFPGFPQQTADF